jgi:hypothetical protein
MPGTRTEQSADTDAAVAAELRPAGRSPDFGDLSPAGRATGPASWRATRAWMTGGAYDVRILDPVNKGLTPWKTVP